MQHCDNNPEKPVLPKISGLNIFKEKESREEVRSQFRSQRLLSTLVSCYPKTLEPGVGLGLGSGSGPIQGL